MNKCIKPEELINRINSNEVNKTAEVFGYTPQYIYLILKGQRQNTTVLEFCEKLVSTREKMLEDFIFDFRSNHKLPKKLKDRLANQIK